MAQDNGLDGQDASENGAEMQMSRFSEFVIMQAQSAGLFLGQIPNPTTGEKTVNIQAAKSVVDALEMLEEKTEGNLTDAESALLEKALVNIRGLYEQTVALSD